MTRKAIAVSVLSCVGILQSCSESDENQETQAAHTDVLDRVCKAGETPLRDGCRLACAGGWHEDANGQCAVDCPSLMTQQKDGDCAMACRDGAAETETTVVGESGEFPLRYCMPACPSNMTRIDGRCELPCGDGWEETEDGDCRLPCPEGMVATEDGAGCTIAEVGETGPCPETRWDTRIEGPSPIFVDPISGSDDGDGTEASPFATINRAVSAAASASTIYLAEGIYDEQIIVDGKETFNLIGQCAARVILSPSTMMPQYPEGEGGIAPGVVTTWGVDTVRIHGVTVRSSDPMLNGVVVWHTPSGDTPKTAEIDHVIVDAPAVEGVLVRGAYDRVTVRDNTVTAAQFGIEVAVQRDDERVFAGEILPKGEIVVERNRVEALEQHDDDWDVFGLYIVGADRAVISENLVADSSRATGMALLLINTLVVEKNIITNIDGFGGMWLRAPMKAGAAMAADIRENLLYDLSAGPCSLDNCGVYAYGIDIDALNSDGAFNVALSRNRFEKIAGHAVSMGADERAGNTLDIADCAFVKSSNGVDWSSGDLSVVGSRFTQMWRSIWGHADRAYLPLGEMTLEGNLFEHRQANPADMPDSTILDRFDIAMVLLTSDESIGDRRIVGNLVRDNAAFNGEQRIIAMNLFGEDILLENNVFDNNEGPAVWVGSGRLTARGNHFLKNEAGLLLVQDTDEEIERADVDDNLFWSNGVAIDAFWPEVTGAYSFTQNVVLNSHLVIGDENSIGQNAENIDIEDNYFGAVRMQVGSAASLDILDNVFEESGLTLFGQSPDSSAEVSRNRFDASSLEIFQANSTVRIENNALLGPAHLHSRGVGVGVYASEGPVQMVHNIVRGYAELEDPESGGAMGDGIQIVGLPSPDVSRAWITENIIESTDRFGVFLSDVEGFVEGNLYAGNGAGNRADLMLSSPRGTGYRGADTATALWAKQRPAVVNEEAVLSELW